MTRHLLRDAAPPLLLLGALAAAGLTTVDVWVAVGIATGHWPDLSPVLVVALLRGGPADILPPHIGAGPFLVQLGVLVGVELVAAVAVALLATRGRAGDPRR